jgi:hypothetical protein
MPSQEADNRGTSPRRLRPSRARRAARTSFTFDCTGHTAIVHRVLLFTDAEREIAALADDTGGSPKRTMGSTPAALADHDRMQNRFVSRVRDVTLGAKTLDEMCPGTFGMAQKVSDLLQ